MKAIRAADTMGQVIGRGRPVSIPRSAFADIRRWRGEGYGYQRISRLLEGVGVFTSRGSVERLVKGLPPYATIEASSYYSPIIRVRP